MGYVGQKDRVLLSRRLQLSKDLVIPFPLGSPLVDPILRQRRPADGHGGTEHQTEGIPQLHVQGNSMKDQRMVDNHQHIQRIYHTQNPLFIQHEQRQDDDAGHGRYVVEAALMHAEEEKLHQEHASAQVFVHHIRADPRNMQQPHAEAARRHQRNCPELPCRHNGNQPQHGTERCGDDGQQQVSACLLLCPHTLSNSCATRFISSSGSNGFFR